MLVTSLKTFVHPHSVYRLEYPSHWDQVTKKDGESCGFGPHERDDVGLWISLMPMSIDTERVQDDLPKLMEQSLKGSGAANLHRDTSLRHFGLVADATKEGEGGQYWIVAGGDVVLFASTQVPAAERDEWNPPFQKVMASLQIVRDEALFERKVANELLAQLRKKLPDEDFKFDGHTIKGKGQAVYLSNILRECHGAAPGKRDKIIKKFVENVTLPKREDLGYEEWEEVRSVIVPVLKPREYIHDEGPTQHMHTTEWLSEILIVYASQSKKMVRFVTGWDIRRWAAENPTLGITEQSMHDASLVNLARLPWPKEMAGSRAADGGRVIIVETGDCLASSRLLHPDLYQLFSGPLGNPFWAGIPCRDRLVLYSDRRDLKQRIRRRLLKDCNTSAYPITAEPFLVTRDGIAMGTAK